MHPLNLEDTPTITDRMSVIGLILFVIMLVGMCVYLLWKLPRGDDGPDL